MKYLRFYLPFIATIFFMISCDTTDTTVPVIEGTITIDASNYTDYVYISFASGNVVDTSVQEWDMGFNRLHIRTNSGLSGNGFGGAKDLGNVNFDSTVIESSNGFSADIQYDEIIYQHGHLDTIQVIGNKVLDSWYTLQQGGAQTAILTNDKVFLIKAANGNIAKVKFYDYYKMDEAGNYVLTIDNYKIGGFIKLKYEFDADGDGNFK